MENCYLFFDTSVITVDVNSDGRLDIVAALNCLSRSLGVSFGNGDGTFGEL